MYIISIFLKKSKELQIHKCLKDQDNVINKAALLKMSNKNKILDFLKKNT